MIASANGIVRGRAIELDRDLGLIEGQQVELSIRVVDSVPQPGDGLRRTEGALAEDPYWDHIMEEVHEARKRERPGGLDAS